ncbi:MAG: O-antigen ligase family protein [Pyrinomonadaceae bacterium]
MPADKTNKTDYRTLSNSKEKGAAKSRDRATLKPLQKGIKTISAGDSTNQIGNKKNKGNLLKPEKVNDPVLTDSAFKTAIPEKSKPLESENLNYAEQKKLEKAEKQIEKDFEMLSGDNWLVRNGHSLTFIGLYLFSILVLFRPYELIPQLGFLSATAFYFAAATLAVYVPTQLATEGNMTMLTTEVKALLVLTLIAAITIPIAKSPGTAWEQFNDPYIKAVVVFIVMVNVVRNRRRLMALMWLSLAIGVYLSYTAIGMYLRGELKAEGYRVAVEMGGMYGNPNEMALHLVMFTPIVIVLGIAAKNNLMRVVYFAMAALFIFANFVTYSRGGFLGLLAAMAVLVWKIGRKNRLNVTLATVVIGGLTLLIAPGNYGLRMLSIFIPGLDPVGSSDQRKELLERSILVTLRNPWGIGIGNFPIVGIRNLVSHNAFTQVSSELGLLGLAAYLVFIISPFRKLGAIERTLDKQNEHGWFYYLAIGLQASIVAYLVSSFFASVAYNWFIYYLIAYAVAFRRVYGIEKGLTNEIQAESLRQKFLRLKNI